MTPPVRMTIYGALFFGGLGAVIPFLPVWFEKSRGLSGTEIGFILAAAGFGRVLLGPMTAAWADGRADRRAPFFLLAAMAVGGFVVLGLVEGFWALLAVGLVAVMSFWCLIPYLEAGLLRLTGKTRLGYGFARGIGSAAFVAANVAVGYLVEAYGAPAAYWFIVATCALLLLLAFWLTPETNHVAEDQKFTARLAEGIAMVKRPAFALLIFGAGCIQASHAFYYAFGSLVWINGGLSPSFAGWLWALGVAVEVVFLMALGRWSEKFHPTTLVLAGGLGAALRWAAFGAMPPDWALFPLQALHALSFAATYLGTMRLIYGWYGDNRAPTAQMMYAAFAAAPEAALATMLAGPLYERFGAQGYFGMVVLASVGLLFALGLRASERRVRLAAA